MCKLQRSAYWSYIETQRFVAAWGKQHAEGQERNIPGRNS
jgi:hypothetical protein